MRYDAQMNVHQTSKAAWIALGLVLVGVGCAASSPTSAPPVDQASDAALDGAEVAVVAGPCGRKVGDTLCDVDLMGYERPTETDGLASAAPYTSTKLSTILSKGNSQYAFVYLGAVW